MNSCGPNLTYRVSLWPPVNTFFYKCFWHLDHFLTCICLSCCFWPVAQCNESRPGSSSVWQGFCFCFCFLPVHGNACLYVWVFPLGWWIFLERLCLCWFLLEWYSPPALCSLVGMSTWQCKWIFRGFSASIAKFDRQDIWRRREWYCIATKADGIGLGVFQFYGASHLNDLAPGQPKSKSNLIKNAHHRQAICSFSSSLFFFLGCPSICSCGHLFCQSLDWTKITGAWWPIISAVALQLLCLFVFFSPAYVN